ncbi:MAG: acetolactate synthase small subunit [Christensenellales bacterium]
MKHIISVVVRNNSGVLARVSSLFGRRGFNIDSLSVSATDDPLISRITVVVNGDDNALEQVVKQTAKLVDTISVTALREENTVARELLLVKIIFNANIDKDVVSLCDRFGSMILDITDGSMIIELTGTTYKIDEFMSELMNHATTFRISKVCRTGITAMERGL